MTKVHDDEHADDNILNELRDGQIDLVINTMGHDIERIQMASLLDKWQSNKRSVINSFGHCGCLA